MKTYQIRTIVQSGQISTTNFDPRFTSKFAVTRELVTVANADPRISLPPESIRPPHPTYPIYNDDQTEIVGWMIASDPGTNAIVPIHYSPENTPETLAIRTYFCAKFHRPHNHIEVAKTLDYLLTTKAMQLDVFRKMIRGDKSWINGRLSLLNLHPDLTHLLDPKLRGEGMQVACAINLCKLPTETHLTIWEKIKKIPDYPSVLSQALARVKTKNSAITLATVMESIDHIIEINTPATQVKPDLKKALAELERLKSKSLPQKTTMEKSTEGTRFSDSDFRPMGRTFEDRPTG